MNLAEILIAQLPCCITTSRGLRSKNKRAKNFFEIKEKVVRVKSLQTLTRSVILRGTMEMVKKLPCKLQNELQAEKIDFFFPSHMNYVQRRLGLVYRQDYKKITKIPTCFCQQQKLEFQ